MTTDGLDGIRAEMLAALAPPPPMDLPRWIEANIRLPSEVSAQTGPMVLTPVQAGIARAMSDPGIERVSVVKPVRLGYTSLLTALVGYYCQSDPSPILAVHPTESDARGWVVDDVEPIFAASPALRGLLTPDGDPTGRSTLLSRKFPGGSLKVIAAKSPRNLRRHNAKILILDEIDAMESGAEGSPITLAERRTLSFPDRKIVAGSTPTWLDSSHILRLYEQSDKRVYEIKCPDCNEFTAPEWSHIEWESGRPETAAFVCPHCGTVQPEERKAWMVQHGRWRVTAPEIRGHAGFHTNVLVSTLPAAKWGNVAKEFLVAKDHPDLLQSWTNTLLAQGWEHAGGETLDDTALASRVEPFSLESLPPEVLILTAGVDVQHDRLECVVLGHSRSETFVLEQRIFWGPINASDAPWRDLSDFLGQWHKHPNGGAIRIDACAIDSGDGQTMDAVLRFCAGRFPRVVPIKGVDGNRPAIAASKTQGQRLFIVGVDGIKAQLVERLTRGTSIRFGDGLEPRFFEELASERRVVRYKRGAPSAMWERRPGFRAESLDCVIYGLAVRNLVGVNLDSRESELSGAKVTGRPTVVRSQWLSGGVP